MVQPTKKVDYLLERLQCVEFVKRRSNLSGGCVVQLCLWYAKVATMPQPQKCVWNGSTSTTWLMSTIDSLIMITERTIIVGTVMFALISNDFTERSIWPFRLWSTMRNLQASAELEKEIENTQRASSRLLRSAWISSDFFIWRLGVSSYFSPSFTLRAIRAIRELIPTASQLFTIGR